MWHEDTSRSQDICYIIPEWCASFQYKNDEVSADTGGAVYGAALSKMTNIIINKSTNLDDVCILQAEHQNFGLFLSHLWLAAVWRWLNYSIPHDYIDMGVTIIEMNI